MSKDPTFEICHIILRNFTSWQDLNRKWPLQKFEGNQLRIDGEISKNHAILVNLTASIRTIIGICKSFY